MLGKKVSTLAFEKLKTELVVPWHFAPKIHFLVNKLFLQNNHLILYLL